MKAEHGLRWLFGAMIALSALAFLPGAADAGTNRALLIGVTRYPALADSQWLKGPANDVRLIHEFLTTNPEAPFASENVIVLADDDDGPGMPTRQAIMDGFARLATDALPGDFVFVFLSGHGAQQPTEVSAEEPDGRDEVFLPADAGRIDRATLTIPNAILDDEIGDMLDAIRDKGAFVWVVFDACHSGSATRNVGFGGSERVRAVTDEALGITADMFPASLGASRSATATAEREPPMLLRSSPQASAERGGLVAFFAAQSNEVTQEFQLPDGNPDDPFHGLFTHTLMSRLAQSPGVTYRQLGESIQQHYAALNRTKPTPLFEGALDTPVFGTEPGEGVPQWRIVMRDGQPSVPAGTLNRLTPGTKLAILPSPLASMDEALGYMQVSQATSLASQLAPVAFRGRSLLMPMEVPDGAYARIAEQALDFELRVARPAATPGHEARAERIAAVLAAIPGDPKLPVKLRIVEQGERADLRLAIASEAEIDATLAGAGTEPRLWLLPATGEISLVPGRRPPSLDLEDDDEWMKQRLGGALVRVGRALNLARLSAASDFRQRDIPLKLLIGRAATGRFETIAPGTVPILSPGDEIHVEIGNQSRRSVDVNFIFAGNDYSIVSAEAPVRLHPDTKPVHLPLFGVGDESFGTERLFVIVTEAVPQSEPRSMAYLAQGGLRSSEGSQPEDGFTGLLEDIASAPPTRDLKRYEQRNAARGAIFVLPLETAPATQ